MNPIRRWLERRRHARRLLEAFPVFPCVYAYAHDGNFVVYVHDRREKQLRRFPTVDGTLSWTVNFGVMRNLANAAVTPGDGGCTGANDDAAITREAQKAMLDDFERRATNGGGQ